MGVSAMPRTGSAQPSASRLRRFWDSTIGKKVVMAVTGIIGIGFVVGHMAGNLQMFLPTGAAQAMHDYAAGLRALGPLLLLARVALVVAVVLHVIAAYQLTMRAREARPVSYKQHKPQVSTVASRTMRWGGVLLLFFIVFHILDMTWGVGLPSFRHLDPYNNLRHGFARWWAAPLYLVATLFIGFHLFHGAWASLRTLGAYRPSGNPLHRNVAAVLAVVVALGFAAVPVAALLGLFNDDTPVLMDPSHGTHLPQSPSGSDVADGRMARGG